MKEYIGTKIINAKPMNRLDYNILRGWELPEDEDGSDGGYLVEYTNGSKPNHKDYVGYISWSPKEQFESSYTETTKGSKTLHNSTVSGARKNVSDLKVFGNGDTFKLICKASSAKEGWMKSTKAMEITDVGCVVQVTTQQGGNIAEALTFVPGVKIESIDGYKKNGRKLVSL